MAGPEFGSVNRRRSEFAGQFFEKRRGSFTKMNGAQSTGSVGRNDDGFGTPDDPEKFPPAQPAELFRAIDKNRPSVPQTVAFRGCETALPCT